MNIPQESQENENIPQESRDRYKDLRLITFLFEILADNSDGEVLVSQTRERLAEKGFANNSQERTFKDDLRRCVRKLEQDKFPIHIQSGKRNRKIWINKDADLKNTGYLRLSKEKREVYISVLKALKKLNGSAPSDKGLRHEELKRYLGKEIEFIYGSELKVQGEQYQWKDTDNKTMVWISTDEGCFSYYLNQISGVRDVAESGREVKEQDDPPIKEVDNSDYLEYSEQRTTGRAKTTEECILVNRIANYVLEFGTTDEENNTKFSPVSDIARILSLEPRFVRDRINAIESEHRCWVDESRRRIYVNERTSLIQWLPGSQALILFCKLESLKSLSPTWAEHLNLEIDQRKVNYLYDELENYLSGVDQRAIDYPAGEQILMAWRNSNEIEITMPGTKKQQCQFLPERLELRKGWQWVVHGKLNGESTDPNGIDLANIKVRAD